MRQKNRIAETLLLLIKIIAQKTELATELARTGKTAAETGLTEEIVETIARTDETVGTTVQIGATEEMIAQIDVTEEMIARIGVIEETTVRIAAIAAMIGRNIGIAIGITAIGPIRTGPIITGVGIIVTMIATIIRHEAIRGIMAIGTDTGTGIVPATVDIIPVTAVDSGSTSSLEVPDTVDIVGRHRHTLSIVQATTLIRPTGRARVVTGSWSKPIIMAIQN